MWWFDPSWHDPEYSLDPEFNRLLAKYQLIAIAICGPCVGVIAWIAGVL